EIASVVQEGRGPREILREPVGVQVLEDVEAVDEVERPGDRQREEVTLVDPVPRVGNRPLDRHATDLDPFAAHAEGGEVVEDGAGGAADLERTLRPQRG